MMLTFRESDLPDLRVLLGSFYTLVDPQQPLDPLLQRLKEAGLLEERNDLAPFLCYGLTPQGKAAVKRALG